MRIVRLGLALAAMASAPLLPAEDLLPAEEAAASKLPPFSPKFHTAQEAAASILERYSSYKRIAFVGHTKDTYEDPTVLDRAFADAVVSDCADAELCVVIAEPMPSGVGRVHDLARKKGIPSLGIFSSRYLKFPQVFALEWAVQAFAAAHGEDMLFVISDSEFGGAGSSKSEVLHRVSNHMVGVGGDAVSAFEMMRFGNQHSPFSTVPRPKFWPARIDPSQDGECHDSVMAHKELFHVMGGAKPKEPPRMGMANVARETAHDMAVNLVAV